VPSVRELREAIATLPDDAKNALDPHIEDYEYYLREKRLRRSDAWPE
jgi:hypothetical protein